MRPPKISNEKILDMARQCLAEQGGSVSTQFIADQLGISQATLFKRFGSKVNLLQKAVSLPGKAHAVLSHLKKAPTEAPVREQLEIICLKFHTLFDEALPLWSALHTSGLGFPENLPENSPPVLARKYFTEWLRMLQEQRRIRGNAEAEAVAIAILGAIQHRSVRTHILKDNTLKQSKEEYVSSIIDVFWKGLSPEEDRK